MFSHHLSHDRTRTTPASVLAAVRHASLRARLYTPPDSSAHFVALDALEGAGFVAYVPATPTSLAGWHATPRAFDLDAL